MDFFAEGPYFHSEFLLLKRIILNKTGVDTFVTKVHTRFMRLLYWLSPAESALPEKENLLVSFTIMIRNRIGLAVSFGVKFTLFVNNLFGCTNLRLSNRGSAHTFTNVHTTTSIGIW